MRTNELVDKQMNESGAGKVPWTGSETKMESKAFRRRPPSTKHDVAKGQLLLPSSPTGLYRTQTDRQTDTDSHRLTRSLTLTHRLKLRLIDQDDY